MRTRAKDDGIDSEPDEGETEEDIDDGLSQDGLRLDEISEEETRQPDEKTAKNARSKEKITITKTNVNAEVHKPTKEEREQHERTHCPFRKWCKHCIRGRGMNSQHERETPKTQGGREIGVPRASMDYFS